MGQTLEISGTVKSFKRQKGFGFVEADGAPFQGKDVFLPLTCVERFGLPEVKEGSLVRCKAEEHKEKGPRVIKLLEVSEPLKS